VIPEGLYVDDREGEEAGLVVKVQEVRRFGDLHESPVLRQLRAIREEVRVRFDLDQGQGRRVQSSDAQSGEDGRNVGSRLPGRNHWSWPRTFTWPIKTPPPVKNTRKPARNRMSYQASTYTLL
jgi:hypothetical protein